MRGWRCCCVQAAAIPWTLLNRRFSANGPVDMPSSAITAGRCFFRDKATVENQLRMLEAEAKRVGATRAINVSTVSTDEAAFLFLFLREKYHTTAVLVR